MGSGTAGRPEYGKRCGSKRYKMMIICTVHEDESTCSNHSEKPFVPAVAAPTKRLKKIKPKIRNFGRPYIDRIAVTSAEK